MNINYKAMIDINNYRGKIRQSITAMEECSELIQSISKLLRHCDNDERLDHLSEEMADVYIILAQLQLLYGVNSQAIQNWIDYKTERELGRIYNESMSD